MVAGRNVWSSWLAVTALVLIAACSSTGGDEVTTADGASRATTVAEVDDTADDQPGETVTPPGSTLPMPPVTTSPGVAGVDLAIDAETGLPVEVDTEPLPPSSYDEVVDRGVEAGIWTEADGLARAIGHAIGLVADDAVPGADMIIDGAITSLLDRANELGASGTLSDAEVANLRYFFEAAMPSEETRERLVATAVRGTEASGPGEGLRLRRAAAGCAPVDPARFDGSAWVEGCFRADVYDVAGQTVRIIYPDWFDADETLAGWPLFAFEVVRQSYETFADLGTIGALDILFSPTDASGGTFGVAVSDEQWDEATISGPCPIVIFPNAQATDLRFRQTLAHEIWHCVQHYSAGMQDFGTNRWFMEGTAEYFSNVVYPGDDEEHDWLNEFDSRSRTESLDELDYHTWIWWQFLANRSSPAAVASLSFDMVAAGDGGLALMAERGPEFQRFVVEFVAGRIKDASGAEIPRSFWINTPLIKVGKNDEGQTKSVSTRPLVATRYWIEYDKQLRFLQSDQSTDAAGEHAMVEFALRTDLEQWKQIHPEVRSECDKPVRYVIVATSAEQPHEAKIQIDTTEQAVCDPCLLGTWSLQLDTFESMLAAGIAAEGGMPPGVTFEISGGEYLLMMDTEGTVTEQRAGLEITAGFQDQAIVLTIDSFAEGDYNADGEKISVTDVVESSVTVSSNFPGMGGAAGSSSIWTSAGDATSGGGTYVCNRDVLTVTIDGFQPITWDRVDRILEPPPTIPA